MSKFNTTVNRISLLFFASATSLSFAEGVDLSKDESSQSNMIAYSQNNLPRQSQTKSTLSSDHPILVNVDLLWGRVTGQPAIASGSGVTGENQEFFDFQNKAKIGFRIGVGVGLRNRFNISLQYTWMQSGDNETRSLSSITSGTNRLYTLDFPIGNNNSETGLSTSDAATVKTDQNLKYQTFDLLVQTAAWMMASYLRFQPFGGLRYMNYKRDFCSSITVGDEVGRTDTRLKIHATGVLIGTDIKYIVNKYIHFFSNLTVGILAGNQSLRDSHSQSIAASPDSNTTKNRIELNFCPLIELRFGIAWEHMFGDDVLLSLRLAYELASFLHNAALPFTFGAPGSETTVKTQAGVFGVTVAF